MILNLNNLSSLSSLSGISDEDLIETCNKLVDLHQLVYSELQERKIKDLQNFAKEMIEDSE